MPPWPQGRGFLITGGAGDIGRATATLLAGRGGHVMLADRDAEAARAVADRIEAGAVDAMGCDVTVAAEVQAAVDAAVEMTGRLDGAFNAAGIIGPAFPGIGMAEADWTRVLAVNLTGAWLALRAEAAAMRAGGGGAIVNAASVAGLIGAKLSVAYGAAKHGVVGLTRCAALEVAGDGIRVNCVCPNWTEGAMTAAVSAAVPGRGLDTRMAERTPLGRIGQPHDTASAVVWLLSPESSYLTGAVIPVDGGFTAQ
ncbi:MAG: SDR family NAD(P)-dependent oxidoreductase [Pseudomonadota bacterium]